MRKMLVFFTGWMACSAEEPRPAAVPLILEPPTMSMIMGNDPVDNTRIADGIIVQGSGLAAATFTIQGEGRTDTLGIRRQSEEEAEAVLPVDIRSGNYRLRVEGQGGSVEASVMLTLPELTSDVLIERINEPSQSLISPSKIVGVAEALERVAALETQLAALTVQHNALADQVAASVLLHQPEVLTESSSLAALTATSSSGSGGSVAYNASESAYLLGKLEVLPSFNSGPLDPNSTYHVRYSWEAGAWSWGIFKVPYIVPGTISDDLVASELHPSYDSNPYSMLVARVTTRQAGLAPVVLMLKNKQLLVESGTQFNTACTATFVRSHNWARSPQGSLSSYFHIDDASDSGIVLDNFNKNRYSSSASMRKTTSDCIDQDIVYFFIAQ